jgi:hypothetical protein
VLAVIKNGSRASAKITQSSAVDNVLPASDNLLPSRGRSINHAPNLSPNSWVSNQVHREKKKSAAREWNSQWHLDTRQW